MLQAAWHLKRPLQKFIEDLLGCFVHFPFLRIIMQCNGTSCNVTGGNTTQQVIERVSGHCEIQSTKQCKKTLGHVSCTAWPSLLFQLAQGIDLGNLHTNGEQGANTACIMQAKQKSDSSQVQSDV